MGGEFRFRADMRVIPAASERLRRVTDHANLMLRREVCDGCRLERLGAGVLAVEVATALRKSPLLDIVGEREAQILLKYEEGSWTLVDDIARTKLGCPPLVVLPPDKLHLARQVLELYSRYGGSSQRAEV